jgi:hypothetical protein
MEEDYFTEFSDSSSLHHHHYVPDPDPDHHHHHYVPIHLQLIDNRTIQGYNDTGNNSLNFEE